MSLRIRSLIVAAAATLGDAVLHQRVDLGRVCSLQDEVAYARMTTRTCEMNWHITNRTAFDGWYAQVGACWQMKAYNTDMFMSSSVFQNEEDGRCVLSISGYHGAIAGYVRGAVSLVTPFELWPLCNNEMYAPWVRLFKHHTSLGNWSKIAHFLGGKDSTCQGGTTIAAESMGGSAGEILAACANMGHIYELQDWRLPSFHINSFYTFGSPAASKHPIKNPLREDGCFEGKRIYYNTDTIAHFGGIANALVHDNMDLSHSRMDSIEIFQTPSGPTFRVTPCLDKAGVKDATHPVPMPLDTSTAFEGTMDPMMHMITGYEGMLSYFAEAGFGKMMGLDMVQNTHSEEYTDAMRKTIR